MFNWMKPKKHQQEIHVPEITARELKAMLESPDPPFVLDVREPFELPAQGMIEGSVNMPMRTIPGRLDDLPRDRVIITHCTVGLRSYDAAAFLLQKGFKDVKSLAGGIEAWNYLRRR